MLTPDNGEANAARLAAKPAAGWVNDPNPERDWKKNILRLHDEKQAGNAAYVAALRPSADRRASTRRRWPDSRRCARPATPPTRCPARACPASRRSRARCTRITARSWTRARDRRSTRATNREACYLCHPGSVTRCLRGAMGKALNPDGTMSMGCQSCHGNMSNVGKPTRVGWLEQPNCQACHFNGKRTLSAVDASGNLIKVADTRFATNPNVPVDGLQPVPVQQGPWRPAVRGVPRLDARRVPELARQRQRAEHRAAGLRRARSASAPSATRRRRCRQRAARTACTRSARLGEQARELRARATRARAPTATAATTGAARWRR